MDFNVILCLESRLNMIFPVFSGRDSFELLKNADESIAVYKSTHLGNVRNFQITFK